MVETKLAGFALQKKLRLRLRAIKKPLHLPRLLKLRSLSLLNSLILKVMLFLIPCPSSSLHNKLNSRFTSCLPARKIGSHCLPRLPLCRSMASRAGGYARQCCWYFSIVAFSKYGARASHSPDLIWDRGHTQERDGLLFSLHGADATLSPRSSCKAVSLDIQSA